MSARMFRTPGRESIPRRSATRIVGTAVALTALSASLIVAGTGTASAAPKAVSGVKLIWGLSGEQGGGAFFGGCNFLSAGTAGNTGSSRLWTQADGFYQTTSGSVAVQKPNANGKYIAPTWDTKCQDKNGVAVNPGSVTSLTGNRVVFSNATGTVDVAAGTAKVQWNGSFTSVFYGGLTYWSAKNPKLAVANGTGTLTALVSGYGADMDNSSQWTAIPERRITIATLSGVNVTTTGITVTPDYLGKAVTTPAGATAQTAPTTTNADWWGAFPQQFVDFQQLTGQSSYWFSSGGSRDKAKVALPVTVSWKSVA